ncbi:FG-GAP repeat domain-containing protein [Nakamurella lactea]|uniref:FG-GAP repeat domain-containing protein n=1 Tax=Nakamurella lactea TaxID=459515 RepID=UPI000425CD3E|nr:VCBS repeat-containing protein [Nakamurella lactea]
MATTTGPADPWQITTDVAGQWDWADQLLSADVTGDGRTDLIARSGSRLYVYPGTADPANPWPTRFVAGTNWGRFDTIVIADVTGDGRPDLLAREPGAASGTLKIFPHNGASSGNVWTGTGRWAGTGWNLATTIMLADVTGDHLADMVIRDGNGDLWIYPHNGITNGNPYTSRGFAGSGWGTADLMTLIDPGTGFPDLVIRDRSGALWRYPHNGASTGNPWGPRVSGGAGWSDTSALLAADVDSDGRQDLLAVHRSATLWRYETATGADLWPIRSSAGTGWNFDDAMVTADVDGDGLGDIVVREPGRSDGSLWLYPGTQPGAVPAPPVLLGTGWNLARRLAVGDVTGDGFPDLVVIDRAGDMWVYPNNGSGDRTPFDQGRSWIGTGWGTTAKLLMLDADHDGEADLVDVETDGTAWLYRAGQAPYRIPGEFGAARSLAGGDIDTSGTPSLVVLWSDGRLSVREFGSQSTPWTDDRFLAGDWDFASHVLL